MNRDYAPILLDLLYTMNGINDSKYDCELLRAIDYLDKCHDLAYMSNRCGGTKTQHHKLIDELYGCGLKHFLITIISNSSRVARLLDNNKFDYYSKDFREARLRVFLRDGEICACCGIRPEQGVSLTIDHIKPVSKFPELALDENNMQVLCWQCNLKKSNKHNTDYRVKNGEN